jgi:hypothetical protein
VALFPNPDFHRQLQAHSLIDQSFNPRVISPQTRLHSLSFSNVNEESVTEALDAIGYNIGDLAIEGIYEPLKRNKIPDADMLRYRYNDGAPIELSYQRLFCAGDNMYAQSRAECSLIDKHPLPTMRTVRLTRASQSPALTMTFEFSDLPASENTPLADNLLATWGIRPLEHLLSNHVSLNKISFGIREPTYSFNVAPHVVLTTKPAPWLIDDHTLIPPKYFLTPTSVHLIGAEQKDREAILHISNDEAFHHLGRSSFLNLFNSFIYEQGGLEDELLYKYGKNLTDVLLFCIERNIPLGSEPPVIDLSDIFGQMSEDLFSPDLEIDLRKERFIKNDCSNPIRMIHKPVSTSTSTLTIEQITTRIGLCKARLSSDAFDSQPRAQIGEPIEHKRHCFGLIFPPEATRKNEDSNAARWAITKRIAKNSDCALNLKKTLDALRGFVQQNRPITGADYGSEKMIIRTDIG